MTDKGGSMENQGNIFYEDYSFRDIPGNPFDCPEYEGIVHDIRILLYSQPNEEVEECFKRLSELEESMVDEKKNLDYMKSQLIQTNEQFRAHEEQLTGDSYKQVIRGLNNANQQFEIRFESYFKLCYAVGLFLERLEDLMLDEKEKELEERGEINHYSTTAYDIRTYASKAEVDENDRLSFVVSGGIVPELDEEFSEMKYIRKDKKTVEIAGK